MARRRASGRAAPLSDAELAEFARVAQRMWTVGSRSVSYRGYVAYGPPPWARHTTATPAVEAEAAAEQAAGSAGAPSAAAVRRRRPPAYGRRQQERQRNSASADQAGAPGADMQVEEAEQPPPSCAQQQPAQSVAQQCTSAAPAAGPAAPPSRPPPQAPTPPPPPSSTCVPGVVASGARPLPASSAWHAGPPALALREATVERGHTATAAAASEDDCDDAWTGPPLFGAV